MATVIKTTVITLFVLMLVGGISPLLNQWRLMSAAPPSAQYVENIGVRRENKGHFFYRGVDIAHSEAFNGRPALPESLLSPDGHFLIHYTVDGTDAVAREDSNGNAIPDRIEKIAAAFEASYSVEIEQLNFKLPPSFKQGAQPYDVYVVDLNNNYGLTVTEGVDSSAWEQKNVHSYIMFDNDFSGMGFHLQGDAAIKITAAHEFFHAIQLGYVYRREDSFFYELTAVWMEDQVFDEIDNYLYFLDYFFSAPEVPLNAVSFTIPGIIKHIYGATIFSFYIVENFGTDAIRRIWELMPDKTALNALNHFFTYHGSTFEKEFVRFCMWNFFTGNRADENFSYQNASDYPEIKIEAEKPIEYIFEENGKGRFLTSAYFVLTPLNSGNYHVKFYTDIKEHWRLGVIVWGSDVVEPYTILPEQTITLKNVEKGQRLVVVACNVDRFTRHSGIFFKVEPEEYTVILEKERVLNPGLVKSFQIINTYPNPFSTRITFSIKKTYQSDLKLTVFNIKGEQIDRLNIGGPDEGEQNVEWQFPVKNTPPPSGIYFFHFSDGKFNETVKAIICR